MSDGLSTALKTSIAPWLSVRGGARAVEFYKAAFGAVEVYRIEDPDGNVVARLSVDGAEFRLWDESAEHGNGSAETGGAGVSVRMILRLPTQMLYLRRLCLRAGAWCSR
jgi:PhnB protein